MTPDIIKSIEDLNIEEIAGKKYVTYEEMCRVIHKVSMFYPDKCGDCSRRKWYQMGYEGGKRSYEK